MKNRRRIQELTSELIRHHKGYVRSLVALTGRSADDARDALHGALVRILAAVRKRASGNRIVSWRPYILEAALNELRMESRRRRRVVLFSELGPEGRRELLRKVSPGPTPAEEAERKELARLAWQELRNLAPLEREVLTLRCHGHSFAETASRIGTTPGAAKVSWSTGIAKLSRSHCLGDYLPRGAVKLRRAIG